MFEENLYTKMEKLEAQICRFTRQAPKLCPAISHLLMNSVLSSLFTENKITFKIPNSPVLNNFTTSCSPIFEASDKTLTPEVRVGRLWSSKWL